MATPAFRSIRKRFAKAHIVGIMRPVLGDLLAGTDFFDSTLHFEKKPRKGVPGRWGLISALRAEKLDCLVLLTNSLWTAIVARLAGIPRIVGFARDGRGWLLHEKVVPPTSPYSRVSAVAEYMAIAEHLGGESIDWSMELAITEQESHWADSVFDYCSLDRSRQTVVINSGSATDVSRLWPSESVRELVQMLISRTECQVILHCGPAERQTANAVAASIGSPRVASMGAEQLIAHSKARPDCMDALPIGLSKAILARADLVISTDSGPRHIAVALDRKVISLFGPTHPLGTQTFNIAETTLISHLRCAPCYAKQCPLKHGNCMREHSASSVFRIASGYLTNANSAGVSLPLPALQNDEVTKRIA